MHFGNTHVFMTFIDHKDREQWWLGRLVKVKNTFNTMYMKTPSPDDIGLVTGVQQSPIGYHLRVFFTLHSVSSWLLDSDVYSLPDRI